MLVKFPDVERLNGWAKNVSWKVPQLSDQRKFSAEDGEVMLENIGQEFPLLDRDDEMTYVLDEMKRACDNNESLESGRNRVQYCFGGVSGSGKTRFAREIAPRFNKKYHGDKLQAIFCRINCSLLPKMVTPEIIGTNLLVALLRESGLASEDNIAIGEQWLTLQENKLSAILKLTKIDCLKTITIVNLDEVQHLSQDSLLNFIKLLRSANLNSGGNVQFWPLPTGLNLTQFLDLKTNSNQPVHVRTLKPVRNLHRVLDLTFDISKVLCNTELASLLISLDGIPRLLWTAIAAFSGVDNLKSGIGETPINISKMLEFLATATADKYGMIYQTMLNLVEQAETFFTSLSSMLKWNFFPGLLACVIAACPVELTDKLGSGESAKPVSEIVASGWAMLLESPLDSKKYLLELPLLYFHANFFNKFATSHLRTVVTVMRSPQKQLTPDDTEELDRSILSARVTAFKALGKSQITIKELLGGNIRVPQQFSELSLKLGTLTESRNVNKKIVEDFLKNDDGAAIHSFISRPKLSFADSGIIFRHCSQPFDEFKVFKMGTRFSGDIDTYHPTFKNSFSVLIQSKRFLSKNQKIGKTLANTEFQKVKETLAVAPCVLVIVTDKCGEVELADENLRNFVTVVDGENIPFFLGSMLARRRTAAAEVTGHRFSTKRDLLPEFGNH